MNMEMPTMPTQEPEARQEHPERTLSDDLRRALEANRKISHGDFGEGPKSVSVERGGHTYRFIHDTGRDHSDWAMDISDEKGDWVDTVDIGESADVGFLEKLFEQDISDSLRHEIEERGEISRDMDDKTVLSVDYGDRTLKLYRDNREYADWAMDTLDEKGNWVDTVDVREPSDVEFLEKHFDKPSEEG